MIIVKVKVGKVIAITLAHFVSLQTPALTSFLVKTFVFCKPMLPLQSQMLITYVDAELYIVMDPCRCSCILISPVTPFSPLLRPIVRVAR